MSHSHSLQSINDLKPGDHLCCIYETDDEHRIIITSFLQAGLKRGEKVLYIADARTAETVLGFLRNDGVDVDHYTAHEQLTILTHNDSCTRDGVFDPDRMIATLQAETERALAAGYAALRVSGEMTWALRGLSGSERLIEYEAKLNRFCPGSQCLAICQYDRRRSEPAVLLDALCTHPLAIVGTEIYESQHYVPPDEPLGSNQPAVTLRHWLENMAKYKRAEERLQASLQEKTVLLQEVHHRVKNNLQVISSLLDMQIMAIDDPQARQALRDSQNRVRAMAFVHDLLHQSQDLVNVHAADYVEGLVSHLCAVYPSQAAGVTPNIQVDPISLSMDMAIPLGLIINELVSNALKHAFPPARDPESEEHEIWVTLTVSEDDRLVLVVRDNGTGLPAAIDLENTPSLGLRLVSMLVQQSRATLELNRSSGASFRITFADAAWKPNRQG